MFIMMFIFSCNHTPLGKFQFVTLYLLFYHNSESVEIACFLSRFPTFRIYGTGGHLGVD